MKVLTIIIVTVFGGDTFVAGSGDDCRAAWENAVIPDNWQEIICHEVEL